MHNLWLNLFQGVSMIHKQKPLFGSVILKKKNLNRYNIIKKLVAEIIEREWLLIAVLAVHLQML